MNLFAYGFRSNFFAAGIAALVLVPLWACSFVFGTPLGTRWPPTLWHAHEMLFGFVAAAIAGFLLTAVPSWTGRRGFSGWPLMVLSGLWLLARVLVLAPPGAVPAWLVAVVDVGFFPAVACLVGPVLLRTHNRNTPLLGVLAALALANGMFHWALVQADAPLAGRIIVIVIDVVLVLATVIGGRIIPAFTGSALKPYGVSLARTSPVLESLVVSGMVLVTIVDVAAPDSPAAGGLALGVSAVQVARLIRWRPVATWREPIVWALHLGYAWIPLGLALKALALLGGKAVAAFWLHAFTVGGLTMLIFAVMTRAALGHTGRPIKASAAITAAYLLLAAAAAARVFGVALLGGTYPAVILLAALFWTAAFTLFMWVYTPILVGPRADGRPG